MNKYRVFLNDGTFFDLMADRVEGYALGASWIEFWKDVGDNRIQTVAQFLAANVSGWAALDKE